jgi:hypothetical protein
MGSCKLTGLLTLLRGGFAQPCDVRLPEGPAPRACPVCWIDVIRQGSPHWPPKVGQLKIHVASEIREFEFMRG